MRYLISDSLVITKRQLMLLIRVPEVLIFSTIQPVMFVLLFRYVFGGSITSGQPGGYVQFLMPGIFVQTVAFTLAGTASGVAEDMTKGLIDRYRSLPIARSALVIGKTLGDSALNIVVLAFVFLLAFGYSLSWIGIFVGLTARDARVVQNVSFLVTFPLTFLSNAFAPTTGMPKALQYFAEWNPVSTMVAACRQLFGLTNKFGVTASSYPSQHPLTMSLVYMILVMAVFVPLSVRTYANSAKK
jgi:ABC-2 type transport system permease protein